ncbi:MAG: hypothetical protein JKY84_11670 [Emcibacteraceae bacterium]|nr:hypothetical protein [Emcibacteraceae bacterium]
MMEKVCNQPECTVAQTGTCLLDNSIEECPHYDNENVTGENVPFVEEEVEGEVTSAVQPALPSPIENPKFPHSFSLDPVEVNEITSKRYCRLIGILGLPDAGKTAFLASLYLLLSDNKLENFDFRDSQSIMAFEEISKGARQWSEHNPPSQMTSHTELVDERSAGFLHLRLYDKLNKENVDFLLPDLPGEWTTTLIDENRSERLEFLKSADFIWIMLDGRSFKDNSTKNAAFHKTKLLIQRLSKMLSPNCPHICLVMTWLDKGAPSDNVIEKLQALGPQNGVSLSIESIASFSEDNDVFPGSGVENLLRSSLTMINIQTPEFWNDTAADADRAFLSFRSVENS